jgi:2-polyprenyl-3-methyl-5-hydroxy-6-metoxy-1,4-benzoquinol methylase
MDQCYEKKYHEFEKNYFWNKGRNDMIFNLIQTVDRNVKILDVGCSGGQLIELLSINSFVNIYGIDVSENAINKCKEKGLNNVFVMDGEKPIFNNDRFDIIIASDVLEHIENDRSGLAEWNKLLKPGGQLVIFVPAYRFLWSYIDELNHHYRRYSKTSLISRLEEANFKVDRSSYWNFCLFFPVSLIRFYQRLFPGKVKDDFYELNLLVSKLLIGLLNIENWFLKRFNFLFGVSVFAVARKIK